MKKHLLAFVAMLVCSIGFASATEWTSTYSGDWKNWQSVLGNISSSGVFTGITSNSQAFTVWKDTSNGLEAIWKIDIGTTSTGYEVSKSYIRFGTSTKPITKLEFSTSSFSGKTISAVKVISAFCTGTSSVSVTVGGTKFTCNGNETGTPGTSSSAGKDLTFTGSGSGDIVISYTVQKKKQVGLNGLSVTYTEGGGEVKTLGDINVTYGDDNTVVANDDIIDNIPEGTVFNFSAANATSITVTDTDNNGGTIASGTDKASWTATETSADEITVTATDGTETKTFTFTVGVVKVIPQLGDITASYGSVQDKALTEEEVLSVYANTTITFAAANATSISYSSVTQDPKSATGNQITYVATAEDVITITALGEDNQKKEVTISVAIAAEPEKEVWSLVASLGDMPLDGQYIIVSNDGQKAMSNEVYSNYRKLTDVTVENGSLIEPSSSVLRLVVEKEGDSYLWKTLNYGGENGSNKEVYLNVAEGSDNNYLLANNPISSNQGRRNTTVSFNGENVNIDFTLSERSVRYNAGSKRFAAYLTSNKDMSKTENLVKLYRLGGTPMPKFTQKADGAVVFVSKAGELHIRLENRDKDGNPIVDVASSMLARAAEVEWTNKVAEESEEYVIPVPTEPVHTVYIEAKSVNNGIHSEVNKLTLNQEGTTTGIEGVEAENENAPVEYFNLQGVRVQNPGQGLYIRRQGNRVEKVALR